MPVRKPLKRKSLTHNKLLTHKLSARGFEIDCSAAFFYALGQTNEQARGRR